MKLKSKPFRDFSNRCLGIGQVERELRNSMYFQVLNKIRTFRGRMSCLYISTEARAFLILILILILAIHKYRNVLFAHCTVSWMHQMRCSLLVAVAHASLQPIKISCGIRLKSRAGITGRFNIQILQSENFVMLNASRIRHAYAT